MGNQQHKQQSSPISCFEISASSNQNDSNVINLDSIQDFHQNKNHQCQQSRQKSFSVLQKMDSISSRFVSNNDRFLTSFSSITDHNIKNNLVQSKLSKLPVINFKKNNTHNLSNLDINDSIGMQSTLDGINFDHKVKGKFIGETCNGKPNGTGKLYLQNGHYLEGVFEQGRCNGQGRYIKTDGSYYEGNLKNNEADGHGIYYDKSGYKYKGMWKNNMPNGQGEAVYEDGSRYVGEFMNNKRDGRGTYMINDDIYQGQFKNNKIHGKCIYYGGKGQKFEGQWRNGLKNGEGEFSWPNGNKYIGQYKNDKRDGFGIMYYPNGQRYEGTWKKGKKHGKGKFASQKQQIYGKWQNGQLKEIKQ